MYLHCVLPATGVVTKVNVETAPTSQFAEAMIINVPTLYSVAGNIKVPLVLFCAIALIWIDFVGDEEVLNLGLLLEEYATLVLFEYEP